MTNKIAWRVVLIITLLVISIGIVLPYLFSNNFVPFILIIVSTGVYVMAIGAAIIYLIKDILHIFKMAK